MIQKKLQQMFSKTIALVRLVGGMDAQLEIKPFANVLSRRMTCESDRKDIAIVSGMSFRDRVVRR